MPAAIFGGTNGSGGRIAPLGGTRGSGGRAALEGNTVGGEHAASFGCGTPVGAGGTGVAIHGASFGCGWAPSGAAFGSAPLAAEATAEDAEAVPSEGGTSATIPSVAARQEELDLERPTSAEASSIEPAAFTSTSSMVTASPSDKSSSIFAFLGGGSPADNDKNVIQTYPFTPYSCPEIQRAHRY